MILRATLAIALSGGVLVAACGGGDEPPPSGDTSTSSTGGVGGGGATGGGGQAALPERADVQCPLAPLVTEEPTLWSDTGTLSGDGDRAYWRFAGARAAFGSTFLAGTSADFNGVLRIYDAEGTEVLLTVDDYRPHLDGYDALAHFFFPYDGIYCMELLSAEDWLGLPVEKVGATDFTVGIDSGYAPWGEGYSTLDTDPNDSVMEAQVLPIQDYHLVAGRFVANDARDVYAYEPTLDPDFPWFQVFPALPGAGGDVEGWGAIDLVISIVDADGVTVLARTTTRDLVASCDGDQLLCGPRANKPLMTGEPRYIVVEPVQPGAVGYYSFTILEGAYTDLDTEPSEDGSNDTAAGATVLAAGRDLLGHLGEGDTDWWQLPEIPETQEYAIYCRSRLLGSGIQGLRVEAIQVGDPNLTVLRTDQETTAAPLRWSRAYDARYRPSMPPLPGGKAYYLRFSADGWDAENRGRGYTCYVEAVTPIN